MGLPNGINQDHCICKKFNQEINVNDVIRVMDSYVGLKLSNGTRNKLHQIYQNIIILKYINGILILSIEIMAINISLRCLLFTEQ